MNFRKWSLTAGLCLSVFAILAIVKVLEIKAAIAYGESFPEHSESVEIYTASFKHYQAQFKTLGEVLAEQQVDISNELSGRIVRVNFIAGSQVQKGQILLQQDIQTEKANVAAALARKDLAQNIYNRALDLRKNNAVSQEQLDKAKADLAALKADIEALKSTINKKTLRAPFSAQAGLHEFEVGQYLQANTVITTLVGKGHTLWVDFKVPQFYPPLTINSPINLQKLQFNKHNANSDISAPYSAQIIASNTVITKSNRSRQYRARVDNRIFPLTPHAIVEVEIPIGEPQSLIAIPATAIQHDNLGQYVYKLKRSEDANGQPAFRAERQQITIEAQHKNDVFIITGLEQGDIIAAAGAFKLHPGILTYARERASSQNESNSSAAADKAAH
ncbi:MAG: efflux RND transporter periplasmic adaptor subunit [Pseudomonadales bacterium]|nr:efflux RND transporter periplasmic adaptor subunit [Pseudomonadales bacterium]